MSTEEKENIIRYAESMQREMYMKAQNVCHMIYYFGIDAATDKYRMEISDLINKWDQSRKKWLSAVEELDKRLGLNHHEDEHDGEEMVE